MDKRDADRAERTESASEPAIDHRGDAQCGLRPRVLVTACALLLVGFGALFLVDQCRWRIIADYDSSPLPRPDVDAPFITTPPDIVEAMLELAEVAEEDVVYDLGCGDGRIVVTAAEKYGCKAWGFDNNPERVEEARQTAKQRGVEHLVTVQEQDIFQLDLSPADVVTLYLLPRLNVKLIPQLEKLKPGSRIVSHDWDMKGVKPDKQIEVISSDDDREHFIFLWTTPLTREEKTASR
jgi:SAM-dependent methyltransferase